MCSDFIGHLLPSQFCLKHIFLSTLTPEMHAVAQEKWGGERERERVRRRGEEREQSRKAAAFVRSNDSFTRRGGPSLPSLQLSQMTRRFHDSDRHRPRIHTGCPLPILFLFFDLYRRSKATELCVSLIGVLLHNQGSSYNLIPSCITLEVICV